ncbi:cell division protein ZapA, partial [Sulfitobacter sp. HI0129]
MPEVRITIGGRQFEVACQDGEESYLHAAAKMLDDEAQVLSDQVGRMPESRMLLMAGLLLADKTASVEDRIAEIRAELAQREAELARLRNVRVEPERIEVPV